MQEEDGKRRPHRRSREAELKALPRYASSDSRYLGPSSIFVPISEVCRLKWAPTAPIPGNAVPGAQHVPSEIILDRSPLVVGRNNRSDADILLVDPLERGLISQVFGLCCVLCKFIHNISHML